MKRINLVVAALLVFPLTASAQTLDRTVLPIQEPKRPTYSELDARNVKAPPRFEVKAPKDAPNVVIVLIDDIGFGGPSTFGGPIRTPTFDAAGAERPALQQLPHHGAVLADASRAQIRPQPPHAPTPARSWRARRGSPATPGRSRNSIAPLAEMMRLNGYSTGAFGKWHETAAWETSVSGPFDRWPTRQGFDKFYGFIGGETDQWYPLIYDGVIKVEPPKMKDYHFIGRHDEPGHQLGEGSAVDDAGQAVLRLLRDRRGACAAPRTEGVGGQVQGPVRQGLGPGPQRDASSARRSWA